MEITNAQKILLEIEDIRQSPNWFNFLKLYGWQKVTTNEGINIAVLKTMFGKIAKIQRAKNITNTALNEIHTVLQKEKTLFVKIEPSLAQDLTVFNNGFRKSKGFMAPPATLFINLGQKENDLWNSFSHSAKYSIRRAVREGARVERIIAPSTKQLELFYGLVQQTTKYKRFSTISWQNLIASTQIFKNNCILFLVYDSGNNLQGGKYFLGYKSCVWYMYGGTSTEGRKNKSGYNLVWESFMGLKRLGYTWLDFEGVDDDRYSHTKQWGGFAHFKEKFGGESIKFPYPQIHYYSRVFNIAAQLTKLDI